MAIEITQFRKHIMSKCARLYIPVSGTFELTARCNFDCKMCYIHTEGKRDEEKSAEEWIELARIAKDRGLLFLLLTGGEPLQRKDFKEIYEAIFDMGIYISINTNGALWTEEMIEWIKKRPPLQINVTLYGGSNETYGRLCGRRYGFDHVKKNLLNMKKAGLRVKVNTTLSELNKEDLEDIIHFTNMNGFELSGTTYLFPTVRKDDLYDNHRLSAKEAGIYRAFLFRKQMDNVVIDDECDVDINDGKEEISSLCMNCSAGRSSFWVTWKFEMLSCGMMPQHAYSLENYSFDKAWQKLNDHVNHIYFPQKCIECEHKNFCVICGSVIKNEDNLEYVCEMARSYEKALGAFNK